MEDIGMGGDGGGAFLSFGEQDTNCGGARPLRWACALSMGAIMITDHNRALFTRFKRYGGKRVEKRLE